MRFSNNVVNSCLLAWAGRQDAPDPRPAIERVRQHFDHCYPEPQACHWQGNVQSGIALMGRHEDRLRWPLWASNDRLSIATLGMPAGWRRVAAGEQGVAPLALAARLHEDPSLVARLDPPVVIAVRMENSGEVTIVNDAVGVGRLFEMSTDWGRIWSNRLGALPVFAGSQAHADPAAWRVFGAAGWFLGGHTPIRGCRKVRPGSRIKVRITDGAPDIQEGDRDLRADLVRPRRSALDRRGRLLEESAAVAADEISGTLRELGDAWSVPLAISLTGGRDSRVSAAGAVAAGIAATFNTGDHVPGEVDAVRDLIARAPSAMDHTVHGPTENEHDAEDLPALMSRVRDIHLVHDGMRNPQEVRRPTAIPHGPPPPPTLSGHGGELGHGFYYGDKRKLKRLQRGGDTALLAQLEKNARRKHSAATSEGYELYLAECRSTLDLGRSFGLSGPPLLDWFYMAQRLSYRSGLGARSARWSACVNPAFIRGAFDLRPAERLSAKFHRLVIARLVPQWADVPFFSEADEDAGMPETKRKRLWEKEPDASDAEEILAGGSHWTEIFDRDRVLRMWEEVRSGGGTADYEHIFDRVVWREAFEDHLAQLSSAATRQP